MIARPVDSDGDMMPVIRPTQMLTDAAAVARVVKSRIQFAYGQWWENEELGFRVPQFLKNGIRRHDVDMLTRYITSYVVQTDGVGAVTDAQLVLNGREATYSCNVIVGEDTESVEVSLDALL